MKGADKKLLDKIQSRVVTRPDFNYDTLFTRPLASLLTQYDVDRLYNVATSVRYAGNADKKFKAINDIMHSKGFIKMSAGTNRICYGYFDDPTICVKVAEDKTGIKDNPREFMNQLQLKPFCTKVFEVTPCGTVGLFERVRPIQSREEFISVADQIFELIDVITNKYILADFGTKYFMNYGFRENFGPVILDFPYLYETEADRLICRKPIVHPDGHTEMCGGLIDYDEGFNNLICKKCGAVFRAIEISKYVHDKLILQKGNHNMEQFKVVVTKGNKVTRNYDETMNAEQPYIGGGKSVKAGNEIIVSAKRVPVNTVPAGPKVDLKSQINVDVKKVPVTEQKNQAPKKEEKHFKKHVIKKKVMIHLEDVDAEPKQQSEVSVSTTKINNKPKVTIQEQKAQAPKKEEPKKQQEFAPKKAPEKKVEEKWNPSSVDLEHGVVTYKSNIGNKLTVPIPESFLENISAADELELVKAEIEKYKISDASYNKTIDELQKENEDLKTQLNQAYESYDTIEEKLVEANKKIKEFEETLTEPDSNEPEEFVGGSVDEEEYDAPGLVTINGTWTPLEAIVNQIPNLDIGDSKPSDRVIVFEDGDGGLMTDQNGNVIAINSIGGVSIADKIIQMNTEEAK